MVRQLIALVLPLVVPLALAPAKEVVSIQAGATTRSPRVKTVKIKSREGSSEGTASTTFHFHDPLTESTPFEKPAHLWSRTGHEYSGQEEKHKTRGSTDFLIQMELVGDLEDEVTGVTWVLTRSTASVTGTINPGESEKLRVSIDATIRDPFVFSDTHADAAFGFLDGLNTAFTLLAGTAFPEVFSDDPARFGAIASGTYMRFRQRIVPGAVPDPDSFWADDGAGAIDLWTIDIGTSEDHNITVDLSFGESNPYFELDYFDRDGMVFDPGNPDAVFTLQSLIAAAFVKGAVVTDLENAFGVGFRTKAGLSEYTIGDSWTNVVAAWETPVPEPAPLVMAGVALLVFGLGMRRRRALTAAE